MADCADGFAIDRHLQIIDLSEIVEVIWCHELPGGPVRVEGDGNGAIAKIGIRKENGGGRYPLAAIRDEVALPVIPVPNAGKLALRCQ